MGLLNWLRRGRKPRPAATLMQTIARPAMLATTSGPANDPQRAHARWRWVPAGEVVQLAGLAVPGGLLYVGQDLLVTSRHTREPALIDPSLPIGAGNPDWAGAGLDYWPSYDRLPPASRSAYLAWLADGRRYPALSIGYVFLFFYGLERRALVDARTDPAARNELPVIRAEVNRLLSLYGTNRSFFSYATEFLGILDVSSDSIVQGVIHPPPLTENRWMPPAMLRVALGRFAVSGSPLPAAWARAWAWYHPEISLRTPQTRCPTEFDRLFSIRYGQRFGAGFVIRPGKRSIRLAYRAASAGVGTAELDTNLPDIFEQAASKRKLAELVDAVTNDLDAYSRWLGRNPEDKDSLAAVALLPTELVDLQHKQVAGLRAWVDTCLKNDKLAVVDGRDLISRWLTSSTEKLTKAEAVSLAQMLNHLGVGVEPDVRFGSAVVSTGPAVLFRTVDKAACAPTLNYQAATALLHLAVVVGLADGKLVAAEHNHMAAHLEMVLGLSNQEKVRLHAHLHWLLAAGATGNGMKKRLDTIPFEDRRHIASFLLTVATADGIIHPAEVTTLAKIYTLLGLDPLDVHGQLHETAATSTQNKPPLPSTEPVIVRPGGSTSHGFAIPRTAVNDEPHRRVTEASHDSLALDQSLIDSKIAESAKVAALLGSIFADDDAETPASSLASAPGFVPSGLSVAGLQGAHLLLLRDLASAPTWTAHKYELLAKRHGLMPAGAIEILNEAALDVVGDLVIEGEEELTINIDVLQEMLG